MGRNEDKEYKVEWGMSHGGDSHLRGVPWDLGMLTPEKSAVISPGSPFPPSS